MSSGSLRTFGLRITSRSSVSFGRGWCAAELLVGYGAPANGVTRLVHERHVDLVVLGIRRRNAIDLAVCGSTHNYSFVMVGGRYSPSALSKVDKEVHHASGQVCWSWSARS